MTGWQSEPQTPNQTPIQSLHLTAESLHAIGSCTAAAAARSSFGSGK